MFPYGLRLFVATPCYGGLVTQRFMHSMMGLVQRGAIAGLSVQVDLLGYESMITRGRNTLVSRFLDEASATHLLFVDADIGFDPDQVFRMLAFDADVVAGMYPLKLVDWESGLSRAHAGEAVETAALRYVGTPCRGAEAKTRDGFVTADYAGTGFMMIRRAVFQRMAEAYPHLRYASCHNSHKPSLSPNQYAFFDGMIEPATGNYLSEDYTFCRRWRDLGGQIWLDTQGCLIHVGPHEFVGAPGWRFTPEPTAAGQNIAA
ncbi:hypothetical protein M2322_001987 [Rhodoblastus acidophilus]|uniref:hypothetical protein n=1 Tax=Rhodoblastus acidophilus TaxID=1074 RepID=UPI0022240D86|nr:hypothetical protein [Rhodoblastus acidophilus]MCW2316439.1 hypothetical protein [Rhodoblastus acidophilus]